MPITAAEYSGDIPRNFLEALVPESPQARDEAMRLHHARSTSAFDLLQAIGFDATGALRLSADPHLPIDDDSLIPISDSQIANRLRAAAPTGIQSASVDEHWSVAGQQGKIALRNRNGSWFSTTGIARTTHIIKPGIPTFHTKHSTNTSPCALWRRWEYPWPTPLFTSLMGSQPSSASGMTV